MSQKTKSLKVFFCYSNGLMTAWALSKDLTVSSSPNSLPPFSAIAVKPGVELALVATQVWERLKFTVKFSFDFSIDFSDTALTFMSDCDKLKGLYFREKPIIILPESAQSADKILAYQFHRQCTEQNLHHVEPEPIQRKKVLLHVCCGPDAAGVINQLKRDYEVLCFWYDPNIQPKAEHDLRLEAFKKVAELEDVPFIEGEYNVDYFFERIKGLEHTPEQGAKCSVCYDLRLERAAFEAQKQTCDFFTTTLAISPHKVQEKLKNFGGVYAKKYGVPYIAKNFMKDDGFKKSAEYTREHNIYRQDYCGCLFSLHEGGPVARKLAAELKLTPETLKPGYANPALKLNCEINRESLPFQETL